MSSWERAGQWIAWLVILTAVMYFGAQIIAMQIMERLGCG